MKTYHQSSVNSNNGFSVSPENIREKAQLIISREEQFGDDQSSNITKRAGFSMSVKKRTNEFPLHVLSGAAGDFARLWSSHTEAPVQFYYFSYLTCLGSIISSRVTMDSQIEPSTRLYTLLLGESADDRKSTAIDQTIKFFASTLPGHLSVCHGVGSAEGLQSQLSETNRVLLCLDEFKQLVSKCKIQSSVLLPA